MLELEYQHIEFLINHPIYALEDAYDYCLECMNTHDELAQAVFGGQPELNEILAANDYWRAKETIKALLVAEFPNRR